MLFRSVQEVDQRDGELDSTIAGTGRSRWMRRRAQRACEGFRCRAVAHKVGRHGPDAERFDVAGTDPKKLTNVAQGFVRPATLHEDMGQLKADRSTTRIVRQRGFQRGDGGVVEHPSTVTTTMRE